MTNPTERDLLPASRRAKSLLKMLHEADDKQKEVQLIQVAFNEEYGLGVSQGKITNEKKWVDAVESVSATPQPAAPMPDAVRADDFLNLLNTLGATHVAKKDLYTFFMGNKNALNKYQGDQTKDLPLSKALKAFHDLTGYLDSFDRDEFRKEINLISEALATQPAAESHAGGEMRSALIQILDDGGFIAEYDENDDPVFVSPLPEVGGCFCQAAAVKAIDAIASAQSPAAARNAVLEEAVRAVEAQKHKTQVTYWSVEAIRALKSTPQQAGKPSSGEG